MGAPKDLSGLEAALGSAIDEIPDDGVATKGVELPGDEAPATSDDESSPDKATPAPGEEDAAGDGPPSPEGEPEKETVEAEAAAEKDLLEGFSESKRKALLKFAPGGKITTAEELQAAESKFVDDYWRNHTRLAEAAREEKPKEATPPEAPDKKEEAPVAPEIARYDTKIQSIVQQADHAEKQVRGWTEQLSKKEAEKRSLRSRLSRGDSSVDPNQILALDEECDEIRGSIAGWNRHWSKLSESYQETLANKNALQTTLDVRARLDRQEKDEKERQEREAFTARERKIDSVVTHVVTPAKAGEAPLVPADEKERFGKYLRFSIDEHFRINPNGKIEDLTAFATDVAKVFMGPVIKARQAAKETYSKEKAGDAPPKPPVVKKKPGSADAGSRKKDGPSSMADLESLVSGHSGWNS